MQEAAVQFLLGLNSVLLVSLFGLAIWVYKQRLKTLLEKVNRRLDTHSQDLSVHRRFLLSHAIFLSQLKKDHATNHPGSNIDGLLDPNELLEVK